MSDNEGYAHAQLGKALITAAVHEDDATRARAEAKAQVWRNVIGGMRDGRLTVGSRAPVRGLPVWVTPEITHGGFATGFAVAGGMIEDDERGRARALGIPATPRAALFASYLDDSGLAELKELLREGSYEVRVPEDAALLAVAALIELDDRAAALDLLAELAPFADRLRFMPRAGVPQPARRAQGDEVFRRTAGQVAEKLAGQRGRRVIEAQREALSVWLPLTDAFVELWWPVGGWDATPEAPAATGSVDADTPGPVADRRRATQLVESYDRALRANPLCRKYRDPGQNLPILVAATRALLAGEWTDGWYRRVRHVTTGAVAARGEPNSAELAALRAAQVLDAAAPSHAELARVVAERVRRLRPDRGIEDPAEVLGPVTAAEAGGRLRVGDPIPDSLSRKVGMAAAAPIEELIAAGVVSSAETLGEVVPAITARQVGAAFDDAVIAELMASAYLAFRRRRSLLLTNLEKQVQFVELPWVEALTGHASAPVGPAGPDDSAAVARRVATVALDAFPGTILPNPLVRELSTLFGAGGLSIPLTEELAADIFVGSFSAKFLAAAKISGRLLRGSVYERYYGLDFQEVLDLADVALRPANPLVRWRRSQPPAAARFDEICAAAAPFGRRRTVAGRGVVIERQQLLTTHNLSALVTVAGVRPNSSWADLAIRAGAHAARRLAQAQSRPMPLRTVKNAAYAWRQAVFFATLAGPEAFPLLLQGISQADHGAESPMPEALEGLRHVMGGGSFDADGACPGGRRLLGWTLGPHWAVGNSA